MQKVFVKVRTDMRLFLRDVKIRICPDADREDWIAGTAV